MSMISKLKSLFGKREEWKVAPEDIRIFLVVYNEEVKPFPSTVYYCNVPEDIARLRKAKIKCEMYSLPYQVYKGIPSYLKGGKVVTDAVRVKKGQ